MIKKITLVVAIVLFAFGVNAQIKFKGIAGGAALGTKSAITTSGDGMGFGINAMAIVGITDKIDVEAGLDYFFPSKVSQELPFIGKIESKMTLVAINVNGRYNFTEGKSVVYALVGLNYSMMSVEVLGSKGSDSKVGLNIGAGVDYKLSDNLGLFGQIGYTAGSTDQVFVHLGVAYFF